MSTEAVSSSPVTRTDRIPPYSEEAERSVLGSVLLDSSRVMDLCLENQLVGEVFFVPAHRTIFDAMRDMNARGEAIDMLTLGERLKQAARLDSIGGSVFLDRLIDSTPTAAHAEYYIDIVRQKYLLRMIIDTARRAESECFTSEESADHLLGTVEQSFLEITQHRHGFVTPWRDAVKQTMTKIEHMLETRRGLRGLATGFLNIDNTINGLKSGEMIVVAARPSMGKTSLAMNVAENVALGRNDPDHKERAVGIFSLEMSHEALVMRMLCSHAQVSSYKLSSGHISAKGEHGRLTQAASVLTKAPIYLDDTGALDILELRARSRRMKKRQNIELVIIDYLQLLHAKEYTRQGRQVETAVISGHLKAMAKELDLPVMVLSQLSRAPEQRDKLAKPRLSDLRDSGAIEQDADVVWMLRRPCKYDADPDHDDESLAVLDVAKNRNGPTGEVKLNFDEEFTRFTDRSRGVDDIDDFGRLQEDLDVDADAE